MSPAPETDSEPMPIPYIGFVVNETPYCLWDIEAEARSLRFINGVDPEYFDHIAAIHGNLLDGEEKHHAATALRVAYGQGLETLFALIGALVQANTCVAGWMLKYTNSDLFEVVRKIHNREPIKTALRDRDVHWRAITKVVLQYLTTGDAEKDAEYREAFARLWERFAQDFLDENSKFEYNSIKHGSRAHMSEHHVMWGLQDEPGVPAPPERMTTMSYSEFGASFLVPERLHNRNNFTVKMVRRNWHPKNMMWALHFISMSISNLINFTKTLYRVEPSEVRFIYPTDIDDFQKPWEERGGGLMVNWNATIRKHHVTPLTEDEILAFYEDPASED